MEKFEDETMFDLINTNVKEWKGIKKKSKKFDLVVMNPPFGRLLI